MKTADDYRKTWPNKTDDQIIESLGNEVRDKVETIHGLLHDLNDVETTWDEIIKEFHLATQQVPIGAPPLIFECWLVENYQPPKKK